MPDLAGGCPGREFRSLKITDTPCPECGYLVEFFSDEPARTCPSCKTRVKRIQDVDCSKWCSAAATCSLLKGSPPPPDDGEASD